MRSRDEAGERPLVVFGSASLLDRDRGEDAAREVLTAAIDAGAGRLDTAPMYGHGRLEPLVLALGAQRGVPVSTKVGIEPVGPAPRWRRAAAKAVRAVPPAAQRVVRSAVAGPAGQDPFGPSFRFGTTEVRSSIERSLRSTLRLDRLLLHEVQPPDVTDELLALLEHYRANGDVVELGCATRNAITPPVLERGAGVLTVAHVSTAPLGDPLPPVLPGVRYVGHGALGAGGRDLHRLQGLVRQSPAAGAWATATAGTRFGADDGLIRALLVRARGLGVAELLVATAREERVRRLVADAASIEPMPPAAAEALEHAIRLAAPSRTRLDAT